MKLMLKDQNCHSLRHTSTQFSFPFEPWLPEKVKNDILGFDAYPTQAKL